MSPQWSFYTKISFLRIRLINKSLIKIHLVLFIRKWKWNILYFCNPNFTLLCTMKDLKKCLMASWNNLYGWGEEKVLVRIPYQQHWTVYGWGKEKALARHTQTFNSFWWRQFHAMIDSLLSEPRENSNIIDSLIDVQI